MNTRCFWAYFAGALLCLMSVGSGQVAIAAEPFTNTTNGSTSATNGTQEEGLSARQKATLERFRKGRVSSAKDTASRFAGFLEFHDANLDGIPDHYAGGKGGGLESVIANKFVQAKNAQEYLKKVEESRKGVNKDKCKNLKIGESCFAYSPSAVLLNMLAAHVNSAKDSEEHRKYGLDPAATALLEGVARDYKNKMMSDMEDALLSDPDSGPNATQYSRTGKVNGGGVIDVDMMRDEAAWLEDQKKVTYDRSWRALRAAKLSGLSKEDHNNPEFNEDREEFMHEVDNMLGGLGNAKDEEINQKLAQFTNDYNEALSQTVAFDSTTKKYTLCSDKKEPCKLVPGQQPPLVVKSLSEIQTPTDPEFPRPQDFSALFAAAQADVAKSPDKNRLKNIADLNRCFQMDVWCLTIIGADPKNPAVKAAINDKKRFYELKGDPGAAFTDARELIYINLSKMQTTQIAKLDGLFPENALDFNPRLYPEFFAELKELKQEAAVLEKLDPKNYNTQTMTVGQMFGIRKGLNDTYAEPGEYETTRTPGAYANGGGPVDVPDSRTGKQSAPASSNDLPVGSPSGPK